VEQVLTPQKLEYDVEKEDDLVVFQLSDLGPRKTIEKEMRIHAVLKHDNVLELSNAVVDSSSNSNIHSFPLPEFTYSWSWPLDR